jgi:signal transduction histidine kinase
MKIADLKTFSTGRRLILSFVLLMFLILGGNTLLIWQFHLARGQVDRLTGVSQQLIAVLRLQESLLSLHAELGTIAQQENALRLASETEQLRRALLEQIRQTRIIISHLPPGTGVDPALIDTLDAIEIALPSELEAITSLAASGDWKAVRLRVASEMTPLKFQTSTSTLVKGIDAEVSQELALAVENMEKMQQRILLIVPTTAVVTFFIAAFFAWALTRRMIELRLEERVSERTRIARELHDTLLQGVISASIQLHVAVEQLPSDSAASPLFARVQELMGQVIEEGRNTVRGFRSNEIATQGLEQVFSRVPQELNVKEKIDFRVVVEGHAQTLHPAIRNEIYCIGREALVNSFRHSGASQIEVELQYSSNQLFLLVRDNGCGIDPHVLNAGREGHWGLSGMRERAERIGSKLKVLSRAGGGTEVELYVPGGIAFQSPSSSSLASRWFAGLSGITLRKPSQRQKQ